MERTLNLTLRAHPAQAHVVRQHIASLCEGLGADLVRIAQLLTTELVTNVFDHGGSTFILTARRSADDVLVEVTDEGPGQPALKQTQGEADRGRGLLIVESLASGWGVTTNPGGRGKTVWFALRATGSAG